MSRYTLDEEQRIRAQTRVREWTRSRLLDPAQRGVLDEELRVDLKRTNIFLRSTLAIFTWLIVGALVALVMVTNRIETDTAIAVATGVAAILCFALAEAAIANFRVYRFGVEEGLAVAAAVLAGISGALAPQNPFDIPRIVVGLLAGAAGGAAIYRRFGYVYGAIGGLACAAVIPFQLEWRVSIRHAVAAVILAAAFLVVRRKRSDRRDDYPGDDYGRIQAAAWVGLYLVLNVRITGDLLAGRFYWMTYTLTWILPPVGIALSLRSKDRPLLDLSLVAMLATLITNKPYLGLERREWDPILLGLLLIVAALVVRRWLSSGASGQRYGFTPARLLHRDGALLMAISTASVAFQPNPPPSLSAPDTTDFSGGRSGGAGGGASY